jgi:uncharacterized membrane protein YgcG
MALTRKNIILLALVLLAAALMWPTPWGNSFGGDTSTWVYLYAMLFPPETRLNFGFDAVRWQHIVFSLALFSNVIFLLARGLGEPSNFSLSLKGFLLGSVLIDLLAGLVLPNFAHMPGYWLWLASMVCLVAALLLLQPAVTADVGKRNKRWLAATVGSGKQGVPALIWAWLAWICLWGMLDVLVPIPVPVVDSTPSVSAAAALVPQPRALVAYFTDAGGAFESPAVARFNDVLQRFEQETSNQIAVAVYRGKPAETIEEFSLRTAELSRLGRKGLDNGTILSVFPDARAARLEVGYGLEDVLTDAQARRILDTILVSKWQAGDHVGAIDESLAAIFALIRDAYSGGRMPGYGAIFWRQIKTGMPMVVKNLRSVPPALRQLPTSSRLAIGFFGTLLMFGFWDGGRQFFRLLGNAGRIVRNLFARRAPFSGLAPLQLDSLGDTLLLLGFALACIGAVVGVVVVAGGGAYGGAGAVVIW